jgi:peptidoglycan hydrolase-like protein with peptidoglycan-binding domain
VRWLQYELTKRGYGLVIDGIAGDKTIQALKAFQTANNLVVDGIAGPATRKALAGDLES